MTADPPPTRSSSPSSSSAHCSPPCSATASSYGSGAPADRQRSKKPRTHPMPPPPHERRIGLTLPDGAFPPDRHTEANMTEAAAPGTDSAEIPAFILTAMTDQTRAVLDLQATRAEECAQAGRRAVRADMDADTARLETMRAEYRAERSFWNEGGPLMAHTVDEVIDTAGAPVLIRIHRPTAEAVLPGIVFLHGGGFTVGDLDTHVRIMRVLAAESGAAVIGVDYSLSP